MNAPRLAVLVGTHRSAQALVPGLQQSRFAVTHHCLEPAQLHEAIVAGAVDVALVSTGPRGLDLATLVALARRQVPLVVLDAQPYHQRWANFAGVVVAANASIDLVLSGLDAAMRGERLRQPIERPETAAAPPELGIADLVSPWSNWPTLRATAGASSSPCSAATARRAAPRWRSIWPRCSVE